MIDPHDPLEKELHALQPREPSIELHARIENELTRRQERSAAGLRWLLAASILFVIGAGAVFYFTREPLKQESDRNNREPIARVNTGVPAAAQGQPLPTLASYRRALAKSPETLEALLDRPAVSTRAHPSLRWGDAFRIHADQPF